ncbi:MAG: cell envelope integrity EipB family protein [Hyphomicrobiaceae bacterium]|nr:cell envelope integrity EipB family protein [Hyphomicrobiaceae bacterium]
MFTVAAATLWGTAGLAGAAGPGDPVVLSPHRAVYDFRLDSARSGGGVSDLTGRMVYELVGSPCEGYTQNMRFVTRMIGQNGTAVVTDMRSSSWEEALGRRFRFNGTQYRNSKLEETTAGDASRPAKGDVKVTLSRPKKRDFPISREVLFPIQHSIRLIQEARAGKDVFHADLYDGSEKGEKVYATTAIIGKAFAGSGNKGLPTVKNAERLEKLAAWPVSISYFEPKKQRQDSLPTFEIAFRFYANGVSRRLFIDYGDFAIRGELKEIEFLEPSKCGADRNRR